MLSNSSERDAERDVTNNKNSKPGWEKNVKFAIILSTITLFVVGFVLIEKNI